MSLRPVIPTVEITFPVPGSPVVVGAPLALVTPILDNLAPAPQPPELLSAAEFSASSMPVDSASIIPVQAAALPADDVVAAVAITKLALEAAAPDPAC
jgi:hypothetical protein